MIFCGDTLLPQEYEGDLLDCCSSDFWRKPKVVNFESSINLGPSRKMTQGIALQSCKSVVKFFKELNVCDQDDLQLFNIGPNQYKQIWLYFPHRESCNWWKILGIR